MRDARKATILGHWRERRELSLLHQYDRGSNDSVGGVWRTPASRKSKNNQGIHAIVLVSKLAANHLLGTSVVVFVSANGREGGGV